MTTLPTSRPTGRRFASAAVALGLLGAVAGTLLAGAAPASASPAAAGVTVPLAHGPLLTAENRLGDDGKRSFGVQPASAKKPDARPNLTYRDVAPGQRFFDHVAFVNVSALPVTLTVYPADAMNTPEGAFDALTRDKRSTDLGAWIKLRRSQVTVPARSAFVTPIEIRVPKGAEPGDHAAAIIASLRTTTKDAKGNVVNRDTRVGTRVYVRVKGELTPKIELARTDVDFSGGLPFTGAAEVTYTVRNTGNVRLEGTQTVRVGGLFGVAGRSVALPDMAELLPGNELTYTTTVKKVVPTFFNEAEVVVDPVSVTGNVDPASAQAVGSVSFLAVSWVAVLVLLVL
ncbi:MAG: hypothetical protein HY830_03460, partial [Actinobacteria bacterium]|nr:hypothetical protein [Actinomycetota bacterium]